MFEKIKTWARSIKTDIVVLYIAAKDARTPRSAKIMSLTVLGFVLSPIDLIPDFIPVIGYMDDLLLVPLGIFLAVRLIPPALMSEFRLLATDHAKLPKSRMGAMVIICIWVFGMTMFAWWLYYAL